MVLFFDYFEYFAELCLVKIKPCRIVGTGMEEYD